MSEDPFDAVVEKKELLSLRQEVQLLQDELSGLREMLEGVTSALRGAQKAYAAVSQRADLLQARMSRKMLGD